MKSVLLLALLAIFVSVCVALPTFSFTGSTQEDQPNVGLYGGISVDDDDEPCYVEETDPQYFDYYYVAFNIWIDNSNASYYFVKASAQNYTYEDDPYFEVFIYTSFNADQPCQGLYSLGQFENHVDDIDVFDGVSLVPGAYTIVVTTEDDEAVWAIEFSPATVVLPISQGGLSYAYDSGPAHYYPNYPEQYNCSVDSSYGTEENPAVYNTFVWNQSTSGYFDIYGITINNTKINATTGGTYNPYLSLYSGAITTNQTDFSLNPCQSNFITGTEDGSVVSGLDYVWLNAGWNYTLVVSIYVIYGSVAVQIVPSTVYFVSGTTPFTPASYDTTDETDCTLDTSDTTSWVSFTFTAWNPVFIVAGVNLLNQDDWSYFYPDLYLYNGNKQSPPDACPGLLQFTEYGLGIQATVGANYTIVAADDDDELDLDPLSSGVHLFVLTGTYVNTASFVVNPSTTGSVTSATSASSGATTGSVPGSTTGRSASSTGAVSGVVSSTGTTGVKGTTSGTTGVKPTTTGVKSSTTTGVKGTTGVIPGSTTAGENANAASTTFASIFVLLLVTFALFF